MSQSLKLIIFLISIILISAVVFINQTGWEPGEIAGTAIQEPVKLKIGGHSTMLSVVLEVAKDRGFFQEQNLDVEIKPVDSSKVSMAALENGDLDIVIGSRSAGTFTHLAKNENLRIIADAARVTPIIIIREDLQASIKGLKELKDKRLVTPREGSASQYVLAQLLKSVDLSLDDIVSIALKQQEAVTALEINNLDGGIINEPYATMVIDRGIGVKLGEDEIAKLFPEGQQHMILLATTDVLINKTDAVERFFRAYKQAADYYNQAKQGSQPERNEVLRIVANYTGAEVDVIDRNMWIAISSDLEPDVDYILEAQDWYYRQGFLEEKVNLLDRVDLSFLP
jgi:ABC-type nitrate/sulfonate/bicarbonate transport system substrate-binding protein